MVNQQNEVIIGYGELGRADPKYLEQKGIRAEFIPMYRGSISIIKNLKTFFCIWKFFKREKPDIVHLVTIKPYLYGGLIGRFTRIPSIVSAVSGLGSFFINKKFKSKLFHFLLFPFFRFAFNHKNQTVIVQNKEDAKILIEWGVLNSNKIKLLKGSGVKIENFTKLEEADGELVVCFAARFIIDKGINEFVSAAKILIKKGVNARFVLAGELDSQNPSSLNDIELKKIIDEGYVDILGYQNNIPELYSKSHIVCLPSYREGLPKALVEAAAASRAVVTTDVPGCRDAIIPNKTGLLVPVKNSEALAIALQDLLENPSKRINMGKAGRDLAKKEFSISNIVDAHLDIYKDLNQNRSDL